MGISNELFQRDRPLPAKAALVEPVAEGFRPTA